MENKQSDTYTSLNGYTVKKSSKPAIIDSQIKELFIDPISLDQYRKPIFVVNTQMIYDYESLKKWFSESDIDPSTGVSIGLEKIQTIPVLNFFLAELCLEDCGDVVYFHPPNGNVMDLLKISHYIFNDYKPIETTEISKIQSDDLVWEYQLQYNLDPISLDLHDYYGKMQSVKQTNKHSYEYLSDRLKFVVQNDRSFKYLNDCLIRNISLEEILTVCPVTKTVFNGKCDLSDQGIQINSNLSGKCHSSMSGTLSEYHDMFRRSEIRKVNVEGFNVLFGQTQFDDRSLTLKRYHFGVKREPIQYEEINSLNLTEFDLLQIEYPGMGYHLSKIFKKSEPVTDDWYLECISTHEKLYRYYLEHRDNLDEKVIDKLSGLITDQEISSFGNDFVKKREFFGLPSIFSSDEMTYGNDFSFMKIKNMKIRDAYFKMVYFIGTEFEDVMFIGCKFDCCVFIGATFKSSFFVACIFGINEKNSFYKTSTNGIFKFSREEIDNVY